MSLRNFALMSAAVAVLFGFFTVGNGLRCYLCESWLEKAEACTPDKFNGSLLHTVNCTKDQECFSLEYRFGTNNETQARRGCENSTFTDKQIQDKYLSNLKNLSAVKVYECNGDLCNSDSISGVISYAPIVSLMVSALVFLYL